jgi:hypothetical protein
VPASQWEQHQAGIAHRRAAASVRMTGEPGHAVVSVFERAYAGDDAAARQRAEAEATAGARRRLQARRRGGNQDGQQQQQQQQQPRPTLPPWLSPTPGHFRVPGLPELGDLPLAPLARIRREALAEAAALAGTGGTLYDGCCSRLLAPDKAVIAVAQAIASFPDGWPAQASREQRDLLSLAWMAAMAGEGVRVCRQLAARRVLLQRQELQLQEAVRASVAPRLAAPPPPILKTPVERANEIAAERRRPNEEAWLSVVPAPAEIFQAIPATANAEAAYYRAALMSGGGGVPSWLDTRCYADIEGHAALFMAAATLWEAAGERLLRRPAQWPPAPWSPPPEWSQQQGQQQQQHEPAPTTAAHHHPRPFAHQHVLLIVPCLTHGAEALALAAGWSIALRAAARCPAIEYVEAQMDPRVPGRELKRAVRTQGADALGRMSPAWVRALRQLAATLREGAASGAGGGVLEQFKLTTVEGLHDHDVELALRDAMRGARHARLRALMAGALLPRDAAPGAANAARSPSGSPSPLRRLPIDVVRKIAAMVGLVPDPDTIEFMRRQRDRAEAAAAAAAAGDGDGDGGGAAPPLMPPDVEAVLAGPLPLYLTEPFPTVGYYRIFDGSTSDDEEDEDMTGDSEDLSDFSDDDYTDDDDVHHAG